MTRIFGMICIRTLIQRYAIWRDGPAGIILNLCPNSAAQHPRYFWVDSPNSILNRQRKCPLSSTKVSNLGQLLFSALHSLLIKLRSMVQVCVCVFYELHLLNATIAADMPLMSEIIIFKILSVPLDIASLVSVEVTQFPLKCRKGHHSPSPIRHGISLSNIPSTL